MKIKIYNVHIDAAMVVVDDRSSTIVADSECILDFGRLPKYQREMAIAEAEALLRSCIMGECAEADLTNVLQKFVMQEDWRTGHVVGENSVYVREV